MLLLKVWGGVGWRGFVAGWRRERTLSASLSAYLAALKGVVEAARERIHHHHYHYGV